MGNFDPAKYATVDSRIAEFYADYPVGSIRTFIASVDDKSILFEARCYRTLEEADRGIYTSGFAHEIQGSGPVNRTNHVENAETSAIGRALANLGYSGSVDGKKAPRPSREEMQQAKDRGDRKGAGSAEHGALLEALRAVGAQCSDTDEITLKGQKHKAKSFIRDNWAAIKNDFALARSVADALEKLPIREQGEG